MEIRKLSKHEYPPMNLLLLADPSRNHIEDYIRRGDCYVAKLHNEVIGVFVLLPTKPLTVDLVNVAVSESHQGFGVGKQLVLKAIQIAKDLGYKTIELGTGNSSIGQLALYQKCGFRIVGVDLDFFIRNYQEEIIENEIPCRDMIRLMLDL
ncbi:GNAT family N-acetyltransferase [Pseudoneobacillus sp. C159]